MQTEQKKGGFLPPCPKRRAELLAAFKRLDEKAWERLREDLSGRPPATDNK